MNSTTTAFFLKHGLAPIYLPAPFYNSDITVNTYSTHIQYFQRIVYAPLLTCQCCFLALNLSLRSVNINLPLIVELCVGSLVNIVTYHTLGHLNTV